MVSDVKITQLEQRVLALDGELDAVRRDLWALRAEARAEAPAPTGPPLRPSFVPARAAARPAPPAAPAPKRPALEWEDLLAGRVMAWVGGCAVLIGIIFFLALAISRGWIGEEGRTVMGAIASLLLTAGGAFAYERRGRTEAALAATGAGVAGGFATLAVATEVYALIPAVAGLATGIALGATATILALRWTSRTMAALGLVGALVSPMLVGADLGDPVTMGLLAIAYSGAMAVCVALGWGLMGTLSFALVTPQWSVYVLEHDATGGALAVVVAFSVLSGVAAFGLELRERGAGAASHLLLVTNAGWAAWGGWIAVEAGGDANAAAEVWLLALAAAHLGAALVAAGRERVSRSLVLTAGGVAVVLADVAFAELVDGIALPLVWAAAAVGFALLARAGRSRDLDITVALVAVGAHVALAAWHVVLVDARWIEGGTAWIPGVIGAVAVAVACLVSSRLVRDLRRQAGVALEVAGLLAVAHATAQSFDGAYLAAAWAAEAAIVATVGAHRIRTAVEAALVFLSGAILAALATVAPPEALADGLEDPLLAALALLAVAAGAAVTSRAPKDAAAALALRFTAAAAVLFLASTLVVTWIDGQPGQLALSALWAVCGLGGLLAGVVRDHAAVRAAALALLAVAAAKVFIVDLASLDSMARVGSFLVLGVLLLLGAFAWQRARPRITGP
jgi:uncharacterized membrane protein